MLERLFQKKTILSPSEMDHGNGLKRTLGSFQLIALGIGAVIGAGIFVLTGQAAAEYAGPAVILSFIFAAIICAFAALCYAEFASLIPSAGGAYSYAYATLGEFVAWIIGWGLTLEYLFSPSTVAVGFSGYFSSFLSDFGVIIPTSLSSSPFAYDIVEGWSRTGAYINLPAMAIIAVIGIMIAVGLKTAALFNNIMVVIKLSVIALFIVFGLFFINSDNWVPFIPQNTGIFGEFGWSGVFRGAGVVFFAYIGFDALSSLSQEAKNPQKDMPVGMIGSLGLSTIIYIAVALILTGIVSYKLMNIPDPFSLAINAFGTKFLWLRFVIKLAILAGLCTVILVMLMGQTRVFYSMAQDGLLPKVFAKVHKDFGTPFINTIIVTCVAMLVSGFFPVVILGQLVSIGTLLAFAMVCFGVLLLHYKHPELARPFHTPWKPWIPILGTLACVVQMILLPLVTWQQLIGWMVIGLIIYFSYGIRHSKLSKKS